MTMTDDGSGASRHYGVLPQRRELYYGGDWHVPNGGYGITSNPANQDELGHVSLADESDVHAAVTAAHEAFRMWRDVKPVDRGNALRALAERVRSCADEFAMIDAINCGNPVKEMTKDAIIAAAQIDYYAGLVHELKGDTLPMGARALNYSVREPLGVVARLVAYNHPLMFLAGKLAPALAAGNTVIMKAPEQAPLSAYRLSELVHDTLPPGVVSVLSGGRTCGEALVRHPLVRKVALIGSVATGAAILKDAADKIMPVTLELGGKNPLVVFPDADLPRAIAGVVAGMNFLWAGQSCGSTTRCFVHRSVYEQVISGISELLPQRHRCGEPTDPDTTMGCLISRVQFEKVMDHIAQAKADGARVVSGGKRPADPSLAKGWFVEPTVFADVTRGMRVFREEIFGPVLAVMPWDDEDELFEAVNALDYGLTASIWTRDLAVAHRAAARIEAGYIWINHVSQHFLGADFGGYKQSGMGREEGLAELLSYTQVKNVHVSLE
jgi:betaine-aldehyde dehydrogenase